MNPHVVSMDAADFTVMFVFLALQMFVLNYDSTGYGWLGPPTGRVRSASRTKRIRNMRWGNKTSPQGLNLQKLFQAGEPRSYSDESDKFY